MQKGTSPTNHFLHGELGNECSTTMSLTVFTQRNFVADFLQEKSDFTRKIAVLRFSAGAMYYDHHMLIGKCRVDFLLVLIELFSLGVRHYERISVQNWRFQSNRGRAG